MPPTFVVVSGPPGSGKTTLAVAAASPVGAVIESNFQRHRAVHDLRRLPGEVVEVFCRCTQAEAAERFAR